MVIKFSEKESFLKGFLLFFIANTLFLFFIFYDKANTQKANIRYTLFLEMKNYSLSLDDNRFQMKIVTKSKKQKFYTLYEDKDYLYILTPYASQKKEEYKYLTKINVILFPKSI